MPTRACEFLYLCDALSLHRRVKVYYTQGSSSTQCMCDFYTALLYYIHAHALLYIAKRLSWRSTKKGDLHFIININIFLFVVTVVIHIYYLNICTLRFLIFVCVLGCCLYASYDNFFFWICASS